MVNAEIGTDLVTVFGKNASVDVIDAVLSVLPLIGMFSFDTVDVSSNIFDCRNSEDGILCFCTSVAVDFIVDDTFVSGSVSDTVSCLVFCVLSRDV